MFALVESGSITKLMNGNKGITIGDNQYPSDIFTTKWTESERNAIGVYTVEIDDTNQKDETFYYNTGITYTFGSGKVTGTYGTATAKSLNDIKWTQEEIDADPSEAPAGADTNTIKVRGLKRIYKEKFNLEAAALLAKTDWYVVKATEVESYNVPSSVTTYRTGVRSKINSMETAIDNCSDIAALETLLSYKTGTRPLGEFPDEVV